MFKSVKYRNVLGVFLALFFLLPASLSAQDSLVSKKFTAKDAGFAINFPQTPKIKNIETPSNDGIVSITSYQHETEDKTAYQVTYWQYPPDFLLQNDPRRLLKHSRNATNASLKLRRFDVDEEIELDGYPGIHFKATSGFFYVEYKMYVVDGTQYQIAMLRTGEYPSEEESNTFFGSFEIMLENRVLRYLRPEETAVSSKIRVDTFEAPDGSFRINFPRPPMRDTSVVNTDVGEVHLYRFKMDRGNEVFTVAYSDYPKALVELSNPQDLIEAGKASAVSGLEITNMDEEKDIAKAGYPGLLFKGHSDKYYTVYRVYMVKNRLYQIAITRSGEYPDMEEVKKFGDSFTLQ